MVITNSWGPLVSLAKFAMPHRFRPSHTALKSRERGQSSVDELSGRDFKRELQERERAVAVSRESSSGSQKRGLERERRPALEAGSSS